MHTPESDDTLPSSEMLDRRKWPFQVVVETFGVLVRVRSDRESPIEELLRRLPCSVASGGERDVDTVFSLVALGADDRMEIFADGVSAATPSIGEELCAVLESYVGQFVAENAPSHVFLHSGCVLWNGAAILVPGRSYSGKTTLVEAFLRAGATYYSDEYGVLDDAGLVHPFPRFLSVRRPDRPLPAKIPPADLGVPVGSAPAHVGCVLHTTYSEGTRWKPKRITPGRITLALLDNAVPARNRPDATLRAVSRVAARAIGFAGARGETDEVVAYVRKKLGRIT